MQINKFLSLFSGSILLTLISILQISAQETKQSDEPIVTKNIQIEKPDNTINLKKFGEFKTNITNQKINFFDTKIEKIGNNLNSETSVTQEQDDSTMMGVMGKKSSRFGGHIGFVVPIVGRGNGNTSTIADRFQFGFPVGLTVKTKKSVAFDFEFIPFFNTGRDFVMVIHPGIIYGFKKNYAVGVRAAYEAGNGSYGITPLISRGFKINEKVGFFVEADFPIRSNYRPYQDRFGSIAFAMHAGFAF